MQIEHVALWTRELDTAAEFWGALSLALLGFAVGGVLAMQLAGKAAQQFGTARGARLAMLILAMHSGISRVPE